MENHYGYIKKLKMEGFKKYKKYEIEFQKGLNILIGENESGKSTILEAINIVLNQKYSNFDKYIIEELLNSDNVSDFKRTKKIQDLPSIKIELFLDMDKCPQNCLFSGIYHSDNPSINCGEEYIKQGIVFKCEFDDDFTDELLGVIENGNIPYDFYKMSWTTFSGEIFKLAKRPIKILNIDNSIISTAGSFGFYNKDLYYNNYSKKEICEQKGLFRENLKKSFNEMKLKQISDNVQFGLNQRKLIMENILTIYENDISIENMGKGKENLIKTQTALSKDKDKSNIVLIEEPENHLSHMNLRKMINTINTSSNYDQIIITTHNNLIVNQLDITKLIIIGEDKPKTITDVSERTQYFFEKSDDYNLLQFLLSKKCILVEGRTEFQLIRRFYADIIAEDGKSLDDDKIDIISCCGKTYKNYIEIAKGLGKKVCVITDNDGSEDNIAEYANFNNNNLDIHIFTDENPKNWTFEVCLYNLNKDTLCKNIKIEDGAEYKFNGISYKETPVLGFMLNNKADIAYRLSQCPEFDKIEFPQYIKDAVKWIKD